MHGMGKSHGSPGFLREWVAALAGISDNPVAGWLMTARDRKSSKHSIAARILVPGIIFLVSVLGFLYSQRNTSFLVDAGLLETILVVITMGAMPAILVWTLTGVFTAIKESMSLLADESRESTSLAMDDMVSISQMSSADIAVGAMQVIMPQLFWRALAMSLAFWWIMLMLTSMFGADLRAESFINAWIWGIVTVPLMLLSILLAGTALVLGCISAGMNSRGAMLPLTLGALVCVAMLGWFFIGGGLLIATDQVVELTRPASAIGYVAFLLLAFLLALVMRPMGRMRGAVAVMLPFLCGICVYLWYRFVIMQLDPLPEWILSAASGFVRSWGSLSLVNPLYIPSAASWGDVFMRNPVTGEVNMANSLELRWLGGLLTQLGLVWINAWLAWQSISRKRMES